MDVATSAPASPVSPRRMSSTSGGSAVVFERPSGLGCHPDRALSMTSSSTPVQTRSRPEACGHRLVPRAGIGDRLFPTNQPRTAYVLRGGRLYPLPEASILGFPTRLGPLVTSGLFSVAAKARMAAEIVVPPRRDDADESIASFVRRRFGSEAVTYIAEPLLAGIHAGDVERLSMRALFPRLVDAEAASGSVMRSLGRSRGRGATNGAFRSLPGGLGELVDAIRQTLPESFFRYGCRITGVRAPDGSGFTLDVHEQPPVRAHAVILACPAFSLAELVRGVDAKLAAACTRIPYRSTVTAVFAHSSRRLRIRWRNRLSFPESKAFDHGRRVDPPKWPHRLRPAKPCFARSWGGRDPDVLERTDAELAETARASSPLSWTFAAPALTRVSMDRASPQLEVGHLKLMAGDRPPPVAEPRTVRLGRAGLRGTGSRTASLTRAVAASAAQYVLDYTKKRAGVTTEDPKAISAPEMSMLRPALSLLVIAVSGRPACAGANGAGPVGCGAASIRAADKGQLAVSEEDGRFLRLLVASTGAKRALEIGAASGYSAIWIGMGLRETGGRLVTIEYDAARAREAAENVRRAGLADIVQVISGDAFKEIPKQTGTFDFVFLDAWKPDYQRFFDLVFPRLERGGLFLAHNVINKRDEMSDFLSTIDRRRVVDDNRFATSGMSVSLRGRK